MHPFSATLLQWYAANRRALPWREESDPYRIWISEIILQQTRVQQGWDYYLRFVQRFPDVRSLAEASEQEVLKCWQGLGYYSRARNLHEGARYICGKWGGFFPDTYDEILKIKGVGEYTAAAIASFAFRLPYPVVDGNVLRVLSRHFGISEPVDETAGRRKIRELAAELLPPEQPDSFNQAVMDFGALQCVPHHPHCADCPFRAGCAAFAGNCQELLPVKQHKVKQRERYFYYWVMRQGDALHLRRRTADDIWKGLYEFPLTESERELTEAELKQAQRRWLPLEKPLDFKMSSPYRHQLTHQLLHVRFLEVWLPDNFSLSTCEKVHIADFMNYPVPKPLERYGMFLGKKREKRSDDEFLA